MLWDEAGLSQSGDLFNKNPFSPRNGTKRPICLDNLSLFFHYQKFQSFVRMQSKYLISISASDLALTGYNKMICNSLDAECQTNPKLSLCKSSHTESS